MFDPDESDLTFTADGSRLLSESSLMVSESHTGLAHEDLSLSDLSIHDRHGILSKPFSLLSGQDPTTPPQQTSGLDDNDHVISGGDEGKEVDEVTAKNQNAKAREEKLQSDVFVLKKLNASFSAFNEALDATGSINDKIAMQLAQTDALLNKYVEILYRSEDVSRLIFDEDWQGAEGDGEQLERERQEAIEHARQEEERRQALQREKERLEQEERERKEREEQERLEKEKFAGRGGARGGTRRGVGARGTQRGTSSVVGNSRLSTSDSSSRIRPSGSGLPTRRPTGSASTGRARPAGATRGAGRT
ncbi:hypothetical protein P691DRAFT_701318 [Macrolepiota fuliginosa MF-IS2]|uniref:DASH complex subunit DUO1 n=1 Tax=Macrolepiota fuliginosa MF-IS2 TaxID=1400762 RepID=A0A9P5XGB0_9AGAR|nr:hypothetical protein P691DRAFT_701318 [Macrolepiota fuliginosa MF-IS2]